ncbi:hypothetical protein KM043_016623 [Ampulex compressa]|nr:hypothetical protein KM043_016623 [Ampulex compressa]
MTVVRAKVEFRQTSIKRGLNTRTTVTGAIVSEVSGPKRDKKAGKLACLMRAVLKEREGVRVSRPKKMAEIRIWGMEATVTEKEVVTVAAKRVGCRVKKIQQKGGAWYQSHSRIVPKKGRPLKRPAHTLPPVSKERTCEGEMPRHHPSVAEMLSLRVTGPPLSKLQSSSELPTVHRPGSTHQALPGRTTVVAGTSGEVRPGRSSSSVPHSSQPVTGGSNETPLPQNTPRHKESGPACEDRPLISFDVELEVEALDEKCATE